jgi:hypothetical protein
MYASESFVLPIQQLTENHPSAFSERSAAALFDEGENVLPALVGIT